MTGRERFRIVTLAVFLAACAVYSWYAGGVFRG